MVDVPVSSWEARERSNLRGAEGMSRCLGGGVGAMTK